jgi:hypothetical protein
VHEGLIIYISHHFEIWLMKLWRLVKYFREYVRFSFEYTSIHNKPIFQEEPGEKFKFVQRMEGSTRIIR